MKYYLFKKLVREETQLYGTEKAIKLEYETKSNSIDIHDLWIPRSLVKNWESTVENETYLYVQIPAWYFVKKQVYPSWIRNFDNCETIEVDKE